MLCATAAFGAPETKAAHAVPSAEVRALTIKDVHGKVHQPLADAGQKATVFFFILPDCPLANRCAPEISRIVSDFQVRGVRSFLVYVGEDISPKAARRHAKEYGFTCPVLVEEGQQLVQFTRVTISPEVAVLAPDATLLYRGRIDDRLTAFGKQRVEPTRRDLREALDAILDSKPVTTPVTKAVGCYLPTNEDAKPPKSSD